VTPTQHPDDGSGTGTDSFGGGAAGMENLSDTLIADPLLFCLKRIIRWHGLEFNSDAAVAGLPLTAGKLTPQQALRAAHRAGFRARLVKRSLRQLPKAVLPAIVFLKGGRVGTLEVMNGSGELELYLASADPAPNSEAEPGAILRQDYLGYAILLEPGSATPEGDRAQGVNVGSGHRWFWRTMWQFRKHYLQLLPASILVNLFALAMPFFIMLVYDRVVPNDATETLWVLASGVTIIFAFEYLIRLSRGLVMKRAGREIDLVLASTLYDQIMALDLKARPPSSGTLAARIKAYEILREFFMSAAVLAMADVPFSLLMIGVLFYIGGPLAWILVIAALLAIVTSGLLQIPLRAAVSQSAEAGLERQAFISESINGLETIKGANAEGSLQHRFEKMITGSSDVRSHWYALVGTSTTTGFIHLAAVGVVLASVYRVQAGEMSMGAMIACVMLGSRAMAPLSMLAGLMTRLQHVLKSLGGLNEVMKMPRETGDDSHKFLDRAEFRTDFVFDKVAMAYPGQPVPALNDVTLKVSEGERIALLGSMGSGKSTLLRMMAKLYEPTAGMVMLDGVDLAQYHPATIRARIGFLPQDPAIFCGTVRENIALKAPWTSDEDILAAAKMAGLGDFVAQNENGLFAQVGERGLLLSGGQRQALALARSLLGSPQVLLLDEPTASLDQQAERQFVRSLKAYLDADPRRTLIVATHKTSMLDAVDRIVIMSRGKVYASGEKDAVLRKLQENEHAHRADDAPPISAPLQRGAK
jgi:ATP-binding cassette subfamily C protein LapB